MVNMLLHQGPLKNVRLVEQYTIAALGASATTGGRGTKLNAPSVVRSGRRWQKSLADSADSAPDTQLVLEARRT